MYAYVVRVCVCATSTFEMHSAHVVQQHPQRIGATDSWRTCSEADIAQARQVLVSIHDINHISLDRILLRKHKSIENTQTRETMHAHEGGEGHASHVPRQSNGAGIAQAGPPSSRATRLDSVQQVRTAHNVAHCAEVACASTCDGVSIRQQTGACTWIRLKKLCVRKQLLMVEV